MPNEPKKRARIVRDFTDAGTGERFTAGDTPLIEAGAFANYEAAGLAGAAPTIKAPTARKSAASKPKRAARAVAPAAAASPAAEDAPAA